MDVRLGSVHLGLQCTNFFKAWCEMYHVPTFFISGLRCTVYQLFLRPGHGSVHAGTFCVEKSTLSTIAWDRRINSAGTPRCTVYQLFLSHGSHFRAVRVKCFITGLICGTPGWVHLIPRCTNFFKFWRQVYGVPTFFKLCRCPLIGAPIGAELAQLCRRQRSRGLSV